MSIDREDVLNDRKGEARAYRYYVFCDTERLRGFDEEWEALMYMDDEALTAQHSANEHNETYTLSVVDECHVGKDAIVGMSVVVPVGGVAESPARQVLTEPVRPVFHTSMRNLQASKKRKL